MNDPSSSSRRQFLATGTAAVAGAAVATTVSPELAQGAYAGGSDLLKVGLIGCGGRGTGAASQALKADSGVELVAMADAFEDRLKSSRARLERQFNKNEQKRVNVPEEHCFVGFDAYKSVIDKTDVVCLTSTPHFRPRHLKAAVDAGKHVFCEKPVAVDAPGLRSVVESSEKAKQQGTSLVSGLCWRYHHGKRAVFDQIKDGLIGDIVSMQCSYMTSGVWDPRKLREECDSEMEYQLRNWYYYTWLSGDFNVEQHIHSLDKMMWAMNDVPPATISASGGRQVRTDEKYGNIYDHFNVVYEWDNGVKAFARCRHWKGCENDVNDYIVGTKGRADVMKHRIFDLDGNEIWKFEGEGGDMYQIEHDELFASIRGAHPINNGDYMCKSTMMAISGRMAAYTGQKLTWDQVMNSEEDLSPAAYEWGDVPVPDVAIPGKTKFV
ncbi:MAG: Gfo/Idh/MocA family oxidoreductase [Fuerstiella sp.]